MRQAAAARAERRRAKPTPTAPIRLPTARPADEGTHAGTSDSISFRFASAIGSPAKRKSARNQSARFFVCSVLASAGAELAGRQSGQRGRGERAHERARVVRGGVLQRRARRRPRWRRISPSAQAARLRTDRRRRRSAAPPPARSAPARVVEHAQRRRRLGAHARRRRRRAAATTALPSRRPESTAAPAATAALHHGVVRRQRRRQRRHHRRAAMIRPSAARHLRPRLAREDRVRQRRRPAPGWTRRSGTRPARRPRCARRSSRAAPAGSASAPGRPRRRRAARATRPRPAGCPGRCGRRSGITMSTQATQTRYSARSSSALMASGDPDAMASWTACGLDRPTGDRAFRPPPARCPGTRRLRVSLFCSLCMSMSPLRGARASGVQVLAEEELTAHVDVEDEEVISSAVSSGSPCRRRG